MVHLDQAGPLRSDRDGRVLHPGPWGIYLRMGRDGTGVTGGGLPVLLDEPELDPYGPDNPEHAAGCGVRRVLHLRARRRVRPLPRQGGRSGG